MSTADNRQLKIDSDPADCLALTHQARKAQATRDRIIAAVIELINEQGLAGATSGQIARRAGITWGAVQHHFGTKDDILTAVLHRAHAAYLARLDSAQLTQGDLVGRVNRFVDTVWEHYRSDLYFAFSEILRASRLNSSGDYIAPFSLAEQQNIHTAIMAKMFDEFEIPSVRLNDAFRFIHRFLAGFSLDRIMEPDAPFEQRHLQRIKDELLSLPDNHGVKGRLSLTTKGNLG